MQLDIDSIMAAPKIKLFQNVLEHFNAMGFHEPSQRTQMCELNRKNLFYILTLVGAFISTTGFLILEASSAYELANSSYVSFTVANVTVELFVVLYKLGSLLNLSESLQIFIKKRKRWFNFFRHILIKNWVDLNFFYQNRNGL